MKSQDWQAKLDTLCRELNITLASLAYQIHEPLQTLTYITENNRTPPKAMLEAIALRFDVNPKWLVGEAEEPVLLSTRYVRSPSEQISSRFLSLKGDMSDYDFAKKIGVSINVIRDMRSGERELTDKSAESVAYYCNVSVDWLLCGDEESKSVPCDMQMITYLKKNAHVRNMIDALMQAQNERHNEIVQPIPRTLNDRLMEIVDDRELTAEKISEATDTDQEVVSSYLSGTQTIPASWLKRFCQAYSVAFKWVTTGEGKKEYLKSDAVLENGRNSVGVRLRTFRKELGLTQTEFVSKLSVTLGLIALIETGRASLTERVAAEISQAYGVREEWLLTGEGDLFSHTTPKPNLSTQPSKPSDQ